MTIFLDANILFSGSNSHSNLHRFLHWLCDKEKLVTSNYAATEAKRNVLVKREQWHDEYVSLMRHVDIIPDTPLHTDVDLVQKDRPILGAAMGGLCEYLVTGDKRDFGHLYGKTIHGVMVVDYVTLAQIMLKRHK